MRRLITPADRAELVARLQTLTPDTPRRWGRMSSSQMLCHLADSFRLNLGDRSAARRDNWISRTLFKWLALRTPLPWPHDVPTTPAIDQLAGRGTPPVEFARDREALIALIDRFLALPAGAPRGRHSLFGLLTPRERTRWAWGHVDHHLRQFGA